MVTIRVKGGTPQTRESLCLTCTHGHIIRGFSATQEEVFCRYFYYEREIRFPVSECTWYEDKRIASAEAMEKIAWILVSKSAGRAIGFVTPRGHEELENQAAGSSKTVAAFEEEKK